MLRLQSKNPRNNYSGFGVLVLCGLPLVAQNSASSPQPAVRAGPLCRVASAARTRQPAATPRIWLPHGHSRSLHSIARCRKNRPLSPDPVEQNSVSGAAGNYSIGLNLLGVGYGFPNMSLINAPPDTNLAVGDTQLVEWINSSFAIFNRPPAPQRPAPSIGHTLFMAWRRSR